MDKFEDLVPEERAQRASRTLSAFAKLKKPRRLDAVTKSPAFCRRSNSLHEIFICVARMKIAQYLRSRLFPTPAIARAAQPMKKARPPPLRGHTFGISARHARLLSAAKAAVARLIGTDGTQEVNLAKCWPQHIRKVELTVHALPKQEP